jgi:N-acetylglutamate synthase-like GNAT family acetyltransferase
MDGLMPVGPRGYHSARLTIAVPMGLPDHMRGGVRELMSLEVPAEDRRQGLATTLMERTAVEADGAQVVLFIHVQPFEGSVTVDELEAFYAKFGFVVIQERPRLMARQPKGRNHVLRQLIHRELN